MFNDSIALKGTHRSS